MKRVLAEIIIEDPDEPGEIITINRSLEVPRNLSGIEVSNYISDKLQVLVNKWTWDE